MKLTKKQTLEAITRAANSVAKGREWFSCNALKKQEGLDLDFTRRYWHGMFDGVANGGTVSNGWREHRWGSLYDGNKALAEHRLMMLAWLYEMVHSGEFKNFK